MSEINYKKLYDIIHIIVPNKNQCTLYNLNKCSNGLNNCRLLVVNYDICIMSDNFKTI